MNKDIQVIDDFLPPYEFEELQNIFMGDTPLPGSEEIIKWQWCGGIATPEDGNYQFTHFLYVNSVPVSPFFRTLAPIYDHEDIVSTLRIKANLTPKTEELKVFTNSFHEDMGDHASKCTTGIYYINTNNGYTLFEECGTQVMSVANRFVKFPGQLRHTGTTCTDEDRRIVINFNYI